MWSPKPKEFYRLTLHVGDEHKHRLRLFGVNEMFITFSCRELVCMDSWMLDVNFYRALIRGEIKLLDDGRWDYI